MWEIRAEEGLGGLKKLGVDCKDVFSVGEGMAAKEVSGKGVGSSEDELRVAAARESEKKGLEAKRKETGIKARKARSNEEIKEFMEELERGGQKWENTLASDQRDKNPLLRKTAKDLATGETEGLIRPKDVIAPYYGEEFGKEVVKAILSNENSEAMNPDQYRKLFDEVRVLPGKQQAAFRTEDKTILFPDSKTIKTFQDSDKFAEEYRVKESNDLAKTYQNSLLRNEYESYPEIWNDPESILEHEVNHHVSDYPHGEVRSRQSAGEKLSETFYTGVDSHLSNPSETAQSMGRFQREMFQATGKRIEKPNDFIELLGNDDPPDYLSPEGKRLFFFSKKLLIPSEKKGKEGERENYYRKRALDGISKGLPSFVERNKTSPLSLEEQGMSLVANYFRPSDPLMG